MSSTFLRITQTVFLSLLLGTMCLLPCAASVEFTTLYDFSALSGTYPNQVNSDGAHPSDLTQGSDGDFYGAATQGGPSGSGAVFKVTPSGTLTTLYDFSALNSQGDNNDGSYPVARLVEGRDGNFYGTTAMGGSAGDGTIFKITPSGTLTTLINFNAGTGAFPVELILGRDGNFYGTTEGGGSFLAGTMFKLVTDGTEAGTTLTVLYNFMREIGGGDLGPIAIIIQGKDGNFYGTTDLGGSSGYGTVFKIVTDGTAAGTTFTALVNFVGTNGVEPAAGVIQGSDGNFYGTTYFGGSSYNGPPYYNGLGYGTVFKLVTDGTAAGTMLTTLANFSGTNGGDPSDLILGHDGNLYGTTDAFEVSDNSTVFEVTPSGTLTTLFTFDGTDGSSPNDLIQVSDGIIYGTTDNGGTSVSGTIFRLILSPTITGFTPASGPVGTTVTITGTNLTGTTVVGFQNAHASSFSINSTGTQITTTVPSGAATGPIAVLTNGIEAKSTTNFTVTASTPKPTITGFSPASGPAGTAVTITGTNLTGTTVVGFQGKHAASFTVNSTGTQITTTVPAGAVTGPIAVLTNGVEAKSVTNFTVN